MDELDLKILSILLKDARKSYREIAGELGVATSTVFNRVKALLRRGVVKGFVTLLDYAKLGYKLTALILIRVSRGKLTEVEREIAKFTNVTCVYDITGEFDVAVIGKFRDTSELSSFVKRLLKMPYVERTVTSIVLNIVKEDPCIPLLAVANYSRAETSLNASSTASSAEEAGKTL